LDGKVTLILHEIWNEKNDKLIAKKLSNSLTFIATTMALLQLDCKSQRLELNINNADGKKCFTISQDSSVKRFS